MEVTQRAATRSTHLFTLSFLAPDIFNLPELDGYGRDNSESITAVFRYKVSPREKDNNSDGI